MKILRSVEKTVDRIYEYAVQSSAETGYNDHEQTVGLLHSRNGGGANE